MSDEYDDDPPEPGLILRTCVGLSVIAVIALCVWAIQALVL